MLAKIIKIITIILSIVLLIILGGYVVYRIIIPMQMRRALYKIKYIYVDNREIDISQFRELIPHAKYTCLPISKGPIIRGNITFKNGTSGEIFIDEWSGSFRYTYEDKIGGFYYFEDDARQRMVDLFKDTD